MRVLLSMIPLYLLSPTLAFAEFPDQWTKDPDPISTEFWGSTVIFHDGIYKAWGEAEDGFDYATSPGGLIWTVHPSSPVLQGSEWYDLKSIANPSVVVVHGTYHMYYSCEDTAPDNSNRIAHATSPDGVVWTKDPVPINPVLDVGPPGSIDSGELIHPCVIYEDPLFRIWYNAHEEAPGETPQTIAYAVSFDGVDWTRLSSPVLEPGPFGDWDDAGLFMMNVVRVLGTYYMFYTGGTSDGGGDLGPIQIGYATSLDGVSWTKRDPSTPVITVGDSGAWDDIAVLAPVVVLTETEARMYYAGSRDLESFSWGLATTSLPATSVPMAGAISVGQNVPNPFNPSTTISFSLPHSAYVDLKILDVRGRVVRQLLAKSLSADHHTVTWSGKDDSGRQLSSGIYLYQLRAGSFVETKRMVLLK